MKIPRTPSLVSVRSFRSYCSEKGISPENLNDFSNALLRMKDDLEIPTYGQCRLIAVAVVDSQNYLCSKDGEKPSDRTLEHIRGGVISEFDKSLINHADSIQLWKIAGNSAYMVAEIRKGPIYDENYVCLMKHAVYFEMDAPDIGYLASFVRNNHDINQFLGVDYWSN